MSWDSRIDKFTNKLINIHFLTADGKAGGGVGCFVVDNESAYDPSRPVQTRFFLSPKSQLLSKNTRAHC